MSADSVGAFGGRVPDTTPHIDRLAKQGLRFERAHVQVGNCKPSRNVMFSGLYPHNNRVEGFYDVKDPDYLVPQEFFLVRNDPDALKNRIDSPEHQKEIDRLRTALHDWMKRTGIHFYRFSSIATTRRSPRRTCSKTRPNPTPGVCRPFLASDQVLGASFFTVDEEALARSGGQVAVVFGVEMDRFGKEPLAGRFLESAKVVGW